jgi:hypothetical protein
MQATPVHPVYPVVVEGRFDEPSRALWLLKWLLLVPHYVVLAFLWLAMFVLTVIAFVAVLFTGRYPAGIFGFNVGVLRWSWRVGFYAFAVNGTDRYPPFTLEDVPDYPARLEIAYPERQRRGLPLIGWWLAGIPQYAIAGILAGGAGGVGWAASEHWSGFGPVGIVDILALVAVVVLLFRGVYPRQIFDLLLGFDRWVLRVAAYGAVMTPEYPPFRVDSGETEPGGVTIGTGETLPQPARAGWSAGRVTLLVVGSIVAIAGLVAVAAGTTALVFDQTQRDGSGYIASDSTRYSTGTYALVSDSYRTGTSSDLVTARRMLGTVRIRVSSTTPVFVGIGRAKDVAAYLGSVRREVAGRFDARRSDFREVGGAAPSAPPGAQSFWAASAAGTGTQTLTWSPSGGAWRIVLMNRDGSAGVDAGISLGARFPHLLGIGLGVLGGGVGALLLAGVAIGVAVRRRRPTVLG